MFARVLPLRSRGVRLALNPLQTDKVPASRFHEGVLQYGRAQAPTDIKGTCLMIRASNATPGMGVMAVLYDPRLSGIDFNHFRLRGFEPASEDGAVVGYLQEWAVFPR